MPTALLKIGRVLLIAAIFIACGGHWAVLQSVAWSGMVANFSRTAGLSAAIEKTFDGLHPCALCKRIEKGRSNEQKRDAQIVVTKLTLFHHLSAASITRIDFASEQTVRVFMASTRSQSPPTPPPRSAHV